MLDVDPALAVTSRPVLQASRASGIRRFLPLGLLGLDIVFIYGAFVSAYWVRYSLKVGPQIRDQIGFGAYRPLALLLLAITLPVLLAKGAYRVHLSTELVDEIGTVFGATTISIATIVLIQAMLHKFEYSRAVMLYAWVLAIVFLVASRIIFRLFQRYLYRRGHGVVRLMVVGASEAGKMVMQSVEQRRDLGYRLIGFVEDHDDSQVRDFGRFRALGTIADVPEIIASGMVDEVILALPAAAHEEAWNILSACESQGVGLRLVPDLFEMSLSRVRVDDLAGIPILSVEERPLRHLEAWGKRLVDVCVALVLLLVSLPLTAILSLLIKFESEGKVIHRQIRVGLNGRLFTCLKFRTMRSDAETMRKALSETNDAGGPLFKMRDDPRCTPLGRRMRRLSLDELPQLVNVLRGEMSLVGPRPGLPSEVAKYEPRHRKRLEVKPGMTGIWQVSGRSDLHFEEMVVMDIKYVENWSLGLDLKIMIQTIIAVLGRHGAY